MSDPFWSKVSYPADSECWLWEGYVDSRGYGSVGMGTDEKGYAIKKRPHRVIYEQLVGPIPEGLTIDHLCRVKNCVNPAHLEAVPLQENVRRAWADRPRRTHCKRGHEYTDETTYYGKRGRSCRICIQNRQRSVNNQL